MESLHGQDLIESFLRTNVDEPKTAKEISDGLKKFNKDLTKTQVNSFLYKLEEIGVVEKSGNSQPPKWMLCKGGSSTHTPSPEAKAKVNPTTKMPSDSVSDGASPHFSSPPSQVLTQKIKEILEQSSDPLTAPQVFKKLNDPSLKMKDINRVLYTIGNNIALKGQKPLWTLAKTTTTATVNDPSVLKLAGKLLYTKEEQDGKITFQEVRSNDIMSTALKADEVVGENANNQHITDKKIQEERDVDEVKSKPKSITNIHTIGKITYDRQYVLGEGSNGTCVYKGSFESRDAAIKKVLSRHVTLKLVEKEREVLEETDWHENVIRYFGSEKDDDFYYLALELCDCSLDEYVMGKKLQDVEIDVKKLLFGAMCGINYLHQHDIVHRDVKPQNILLKVVAPNEVKALISDCDLCRKVPDGQRYVTTQYGMAGTFGWIAPEMSEKTSEVTPAVDIFAMGCIIYYVLSRGKHPFGDPAERQDNIKRENFSLAYLDEKDHDKVMAKDLVKLMINKNYKLRPTSEEALCHCLFWCKDRQLKFFDEISNWLEEVRYPPAMKALENGAKKVIKGDWTKHIDKELMEDLKEHRQYNGTSVQELLRAIRNKKSHYHMSSKTLKGKIGSIPDGTFVTYFTDQFPLLLIHTYSVIKKEAGAKFEHFFKIKDQCFYDHV